MKSETHPSPEDHFSESGINELSGEGKQEEPEQRLEQHKEPVVSQEKYSPEQRKEIISAVEALKPTVEAMVHTGVRLSVEDRPGLTLAFDPNKGIIFSPSFLLERGLSQEEIVAALGHEAGHFLQMIQDPEEYLKAIEYAKEKGGDSKIKQQIWWNLLNGLSDLNANSRMRHYLEPYSKGGAREHVLPHIYEHTLFPAQEGLPTPDYTSVPFAQQFVNYILRTMESPESEPPIISEEVKNELETPIKAFGREMTIQQFLQTYIRPHHIPEKHRLEYVKRFIAPIYERLMQEDEKRGDLKIPPPEHSLDPSLDEIEAIAKGMKREKDEQNKTPAEKHQDMERKSFEKWAKDQQFSEEEIDMLWSIRKSAEQEAERLTDLWKLFLRKIQSVQMEKVTAQKRGFALDVKELIKQFPALQKDPEQLRVMEKYLPEISERTLPKEIVLMLALDLSGSMDADKRRAVQEAAYAILSSLERFGNEMRLAEEVDEQGNPLVVVRAYTVGFGSEAEELSNPAKKGAIESADIAKIIIGIGKDLEGTYDDKALQLLYQKVSPADFGKIRSGEEIAIVIEITDGDTQTEENSRNLIQTMNQKNIKTFGIQIPGKNQGTFGRVWGENGKLLNDISQLKETLLELLAQAISERASQ